MIDKIGMGMANMANKQMSLMDVIRKIRDYGKTGMQYAKENKGPAAMIAGAGGLGGAGLASYLGEEEVSEEEKLAQLLERLRAQRAGYGA